MSSTSSASSDAQDSLNICSNNAAQQLLRCFFCERYLSVAPIYNHEFESICGRCRFVKGDAKWTRQALYESVAQFLVFPCSNAMYGCGVQLKWGQVEEHENACRFKKINCPFSYDHFPVSKCKWTGSGPALNEHLESLHGDTIKKLPEINFTETKTSLMFVTKILRQLMVVTVKFEAPEKFSCLVMINGGAGDAYRYQLELYDDQRKHSLILRRNRLEDCVVFEENFASEDKMISIDLSVASNLLKNPANIMGRFGIIKKSKRDLNQAEKCSEVCFDENFLREMECPVCKNYMVPPIEICSTGHSFCSRCRQQMDECPTCRHPFQDGRNYTLEKLSACMNFPCMNKDSGCSFTSSSEGLREHELQCSFSGSTCFLLNCNKSTVMNIVKHLNESHSDSLLAAGEVQLFHIRAHQDLLTLFAICFGSDVFRFAVLYEGDVKFSLQQFGVNQVNYVYELEIICSVDTAEKIVIGKDCLPMNGNTIWERCIDVPEHMLTRFISDEELLFFRVHLKKKQ